MTCPGSGIYLNTNMNDVLMQAQFLIACEQSDAMLDVEDVVKIKKWEDLKQYYLTYYID